MLSPPWTQEEGGKEGRREGREGKGHTKRKSKDLAQEVSEKMKRCRITMSPGELRLRKVREGGRAGGREGGREGGRRHQRCGDQGETTGPGDPLVLAETFLRIERAPALSLREEIVDRAREKEEA
jgi:hypothetical protein